MFCYNLTQNLTQNIMESIMPTLKKTKFNGVYYRDSTKVTENRKPDRCFYIRYYENGKCINKKIGWASEGYTAQVVANMKAEKISEFSKKNIETMKEQRSHR